MDSSMCHKMHLVTNWLSPSYVTKGACPCILNFMLCNNLELYLYSYIYDEIDELP